MTADFGFPCFCLSLVRATERRRVAAQRAVQQQLPLRFVDAFDTQELPSGFFREKYRCDLNFFLYKRSLSLPEISCFLGHRRIWQIVSEERAQASLVLEDDFEFARQSRNELQNIAQWVSEQVQPTMVKLDAGSAPQSSRMRLVSESLGLYQTFKIPMRTGGYIINRAAAESLLSHLLPVVAPVDVQLSFTWMHQTCIYSVYPAMVRTPNDVPSMIEPERSAGTLFGVVFRGLRNIPFQAHQKIWRWVSWRVGR